MAITLTSTGLIQHTDFSGVALPAWLAPAAGSGGSVTVGSGYCSCLTDANNKWAFILTADALDNALTRAIRAKATIQTGGSFGQHVVQSAIIQAGSVPSPITLGTNHLMSMQYNDQQSDADQSGYDYWGHTKGYDDTAFGRGTYYLFDTLYDGAGTGDITYLYRNASTFAVIGTGSHAPNWAGDYFWLGGDLYSAYSYGDIRYDYLQILKSFSAVVTGLAGGNYVAITDAADVVKASGTAAGASLSIGIATIGDFPFSGKVKIYDEEGGTLLALVSNSTIYGGDTYAYDGPDFSISAITPATGVNTGEVEVTDLAGTGFYDSPTIKLKKAGEDDITATDVTVVSAAKITCTFDIASAELGDWDVEVTI